MGLLHSFAPGATAVSLASDTSFSEPVGVYVGVAGDVKVDTIENTAVVLKAQAGAVLPVAVRKVYSTANGTTATDLVSLRINV